MEQAVNILGTHDPKYLCNYPLKQNRKDGTKYNYGAVAGLKLLTGSNGILHQIGANGSLEPYTLKQYRVVLDANSAAIFDKMVADPISPLFDYITETARLNNNEQSTTFSGNADDPEDNKAAQNKKELSTDNQEEFQDMYDHTDYTEYEQSLQHSIDKVKRAIYAYDSLAKTCRLPSAPFSVSGDDIDKVNAITKYIVDLCKKLGIEVKVITGRLSGRESREVHIAKLNPFIKKRMYKVLSRNISLTHNPDNQKKVKQFLQSLLSFSWTVVDKIKELYTSITFDDQPVVKDIENTSTETKPNPESDNNVAANQNSDEETEDYDDIMMMMQGNSML